MYIGLVILNWGFYVPFAEEKNVYFSLKLTVTGMELLLKEIYAWNSNIVKNFAFMVYVSHVQKPTFSGVNLFIGIFSFSLDGRERFQSSKWGLF